MSDIPEANPSILDVLKEHGWKPDQGEPETSDTAPDVEQEVEEGPPPAPKEDVTVDLPADMLERMSPPKKERVRNTAGGVFKSPEAEVTNTDPWTRTIEQLGKVSVTNGELETYTKALVFDSRFEIPVNLFMGQEPFTVVVRSLYVSEREVMALAVSEIANSYPIQTLQNATIVADYYLKLAIMIQVVSINGVPQAPYDARPEEGQLPEESPKVKELVRIARTKFGQTHQAKLKTLIRALHTFETKQQILEDAYHNRDFPRPVDAY